MAATATTKKKVNEALRRLLDYDIDNALNVVDLGTPQGAGNKCIPIARWKRFLAGFFHSLGAGTVTKFQIIAATAADGTGATIVVDKDLTANPNAVGDFVFAECTVEQVREVLANATHVGVRVQLNTAGDEAVIYFEADGMDSNKADLTADFIS